MSHPIDIIFKAINDLLEMSEYALMPISSSQAVNLAYVVFARNPILLQDLWAWNCHSAEFLTWDAMKIHLCKAQCDPLSLPVAGQMYNQELQQANLVQIPGSILYKGAPPTPNTSQLSNSYYATLTPTDTSSYSDASTMRPAALIEIANNVQQHAAELQA